MPTTYLVTISRILTRELPGLPPRRKNVGLDRYAIFAMRLAYWSARYKVLSKDHFRGPTGPLRHAAGE